MLCLQLAVYCTCFSGRVLYIFVQVYIVGRGYHTIWTNNFWYRIAGSGHLAACALVIAIQYTVRRRHVCRRRSVMNAILAGKTYIWEGTIAKLDPPPALAARDFTTPPFSNKKCRMKERSILFTAQARMNQSLVPLRAGKSILHRRLGAKSTNGLNFIQKFWSHTLSFNHSLDINF